jgi:hypothetical protein
MTPHRSPNGNGASTGPDGGDPRAAEPNTAQASDDESATAEPNPLAGLLSNLAELREYAALYLATHADSVKLSARQAVLKAAVGVIGLVAAVAIVATAGVLLVTGMANGIALLLGDRLWAGQLITAVVILSVLAGGAYAGLRIVLKSSRNRTVEKYERRHQQQRAAFGHDVRQRAQQSAG